MNVEHGFKVGDILAGTWGYSMTLSKFLRVEKVLPKSITVMELETQPSDSLHCTHPFDGCQGYVEPILEQKRNKLSKTCRVKKSTFNMKEFIIFQDCLCNKWDGKPIYENHMD